jgi:hypothetical protein
MFNKASNGTTDGYYIDWSQDNSLENWIQMFDLRCSGDWGIGLFASSYFLGHVFGNIIVKYGDTVGRMPIIRVTHNLSLVIYALIIFISRNNYVSYVLFFILGFLSNVRTNLAFIYGQEIVAQKY